LLVKPFMHPEAPGTVIKDSAVTNFAKPVIIVKQNQVLLSLSAKSYSFISEDQLSDIFSRLAKHHIKVNVMQTSALSFTVCFDKDDARFEALLKSLTDYNVKYNTGLTLITTRHYKPETLKELTTDKTVLLEQTSRNTAQVVVRD